MTTARASAREDRETFSTVLAGAAWSLTAVPLVNPIAGEMLFRVAAASIGAVTIFPALLLVYLESDRGVAASRFLLGAGTAVLASLGLAYTGTVEPWQVAFGYLLPAAALLSILAPRQAAVRQDLPALEAEVDGQMR